MYILDLYYICIHQTIYEITSFFLNLENWDLTKVLNSTVFYIIFLFLTEIFIYTFFKQIQTLSKTILGEPCVFQPTAQYSRYRNPFPVHPCGINVTLTSPVRLTPSWSYIYLALQRIPTSKPTMFQNLSCNLRADEVLMLATTIPCLSCPELT